MIIANFVFLCFAELQKQIAENIEQINFGSFYLPNKRKTLRSVTVGGQVDKKVGWFQWGKV